MVLFISKMVHYKKHSLGKLIRMFLLFVFKQLSTVGNVHYYGYICVSACVLVFLHERPKLVGLYDVQVYNNEL